MPICYKGVDCICNQEGETVAQITDRITHHNSNCSGNLERIQYQIQTFMDKAIR